MRKLYLLRHAQASSDFAKEDKVRTLSKHGISQAMALAPLIEGIDKTLCSSAKRTQMTAQSLQKAGADLGVIEYQDSLYNASAGDLLSAIQTQSAQNLLIIAHNPGIHLLARSMANKGDEQKRNKLDITYRPASLSIFECDIDNWQNLNPQSNTLLDFIESD